MLISEGSLEEVRRAASGSIVEIAGEYTALRRQGSRYFGLCPFHSERTASFAVSPDKGLYVCHGCKAGGDAIKLVMELEGISFTEAVRELGERCGVQVDDAEESPERRQEREEEARRERETLRAMDFACRYYRMALKSSGEGGAAREYLEQRGVSEGVSERFALGYSPLDARRAPGGGLLALAEKKGASPEALRESGLLSGEGERFAGRLVFPISDRRGRVVGFGGRVLDTGGDGGGAQAKYLNSPESALFKKGSTLYGLAEAAETIRSEGRALVVEGYTDVLACHGAGVSEAVGVLGTSLTEAHLKALSRLSRQIVCLFDPDEAGDRAAERAAGLSASLGLDVRVLRISKDPADWLASEGDGDDLRDMASNADPVLEFAARRIALRVSGAGAAERSAALEDARGMAALIDDPVLLREALRVLSWALDVRESDVAPPDGRSGYAAASHSPKNSGGSRRISAHLQAGRDLLQAMACAPEIAAPFLREGVDLSGGEHFEVRARDFESTAAGESQAALYLLLSEHAGEDLDSTLSDERLREYLGAISSLVHRGEDEGSVYSGQEIREVFLRLLALSRQRDHRRAEDPDSRESLYREKTLLSRELNGE